MRVRSPAVGAEPYEIASPFTVGKELGHGGTSMVEKVYSHLGQVRHRSEVVEFNIEHHREALGKRLTALEKLTN